MFSRKSLQTLHRRKVLECVSCLSGNVTPWRYLCQAACSSSSLLRSGASCCTFTQSCLMWESTNSRHWLRGTIRHSQVSMVTADMGVHFPLAPISSLHSWKEPFSCKAHFAYTRNFFQNVLAWNVCYKYMCDIN